MSTPYCMLNVIIVYWVCCLFIIFLTALFSCLLYFFLLASNAPKKAILISRIIYVNYPSFLARQDKLPGCIFFLISLLYSHKKKEESLVIGKLL